jgi:hypothetical protein
MEPLKLELSPQDTRDYSRIHEYYEKYTELEENKIRRPEYVICRFFPVTNLSVWQL